MIYHPILDLYVLLFWRDVGVAAVSILEKGFLICIIDAYKEFTYTQH